MERIGIAASKIAQGNLLLYNLYVLLITFLISILLFFLAGSVTFLGLWIIRLVLRPFVPWISPGLWNLIFCYSLVALTILVALISIAAISKNIRFKK